MVHIVRPLSSRTGGDRGSTCARLFRNQAPDHVSGRALSFGTHRGGGSVGRLAAVVAAVVPAGWPDGCTRPPENPRHPRASGRRPDRDDRPRAADPRRQPLVRAWLAARAVCKCRFPRPLPARLAVGRHPWRRGSHASARHSRRPTRSLPKMEIPRAGAHRAGRCGERDPRNNLCRKPGLQLYHHCALDSHRHQRGQFSGQHEWPLPGTWPDRRLVLRVARRA